MDALELDQAALAGYDWGGRACCIASILAPERIRGLVTAGGYNVQNTVTPAGPGSAIEERAYWYQWYLNTERGRLGFEQNRRELCLLLWQEWSPSWAFDLQTFERTAPSFENPDFVAVVTHSYRHRHGNAAGEPRFDVVEELLAGRPSIQVPTVILHGADDHVTHPRRSEKHQALFPAGTPRRVIPGVGHFLPREAPQVVVEAVKELLGTRPG